MDNTSIEFIIGVNLQMKWQTYRCWNLMRPIRRLPMVVRIVECSALFVFQPVRFCYCHAMRLSCVPKRPHYPRCHLHLTSIVAFKFVFYALYYDLSYKVINGCFKRIRCVLLYDFSFFLCSYFSLSKFKVWMECF